MCVLISSFFNFKILCFLFSPELTLVYWNLVTGREATRITLSEDQSLTKHASSLLFSNDLSACALLVPEGKEEECTLCLWTLKLKVEEEPKEEEEDEEEKVEVRPDVVSRRSGRSVSSGGSAGSSKKRPKDFDLRELKLQLIPTAIGFALNDAVLLGTSSGLTLVVATATLSVTSALTAEGVEPVSSQVLTAAGTWTRFSPAHASGVKKITCAAGSHVIASTCGQTLCVWNLLQKRLLVRIPLKGEEVSFQP